MNVCTVQVRSISREYLKGEALLDISAYTATRPVVDWWRLIVTPVKVVAFGSRDNDSRWRGIYRRVFLIFLRKLKTWSRHHFVMCIVARSSDLGKQEGAIDRKARPEAAQGRTTVAINHQYLCIAKIGGLRIKPRIVGTKNRFVADGCRRRTRGWRRRRRRRRRRGRR